MDIIEKLVRIVAYLGVILFVGVRTYQAFTPQVSNSARQASTLVGKQLDSNVQIEAGAGGLLFVVSTTCPYCKASAPFYQKLTEEVIPGLSGKVESLAIFSEDVESAKRYAKEVLRGRFDKIVQGHVAGISATPTLLLVDNQRVVRGTWVGKQRPEGESEIIKALQDMTKKRVVGRKAVAFDSLWATRTSFYSREKFTVSGVSILADPAMLIKGVH